MFLFRKREVFANAAVMICRHPGEFGCHAVEKAAKAAGCWFPQWYVTAYEDAYLPLDAERGSAWLFDSEGQWMSAAAWDLRFCALTALAHSDITSQCHIESVIQRNHSSKLERQEQRTA